MSRYRSAIRGVLACACLLASTFSFAQNRITGQPVQEGDKALKQQVQQDAWFRTGRTASAQSNAALLQRAQQQKKALATTIYAQTEAQSFFQSGLQWKSMGPAPVMDPDYGFVAGRVTAVAVDPTDATGNTVYAGGAYGGLWRSTNASADPRDVVWAPLMQNAPTLAVGAIAIKPDNSSVILVGTGNTQGAPDSYYGLGIMRSEDGGVTWTQIADAAPASGSTRISFKGFGFSSIAFSTQNPSLVVASVSIALNAEGLAICPGCVPAGGFYYSTDAGKTWTASTIKDTTIPMTGGGITSVTYDAADKTFYGAVSYHGIYSSSDGVTWTRLANQPLGAAMDLTACPTQGSTVNCPIYRAALAARPGTVNELYAWIVDPHQSGSLAVTRDSGATWTVLNDSGIENCGDTGNPSGCGAWILDLALAAVPNGDGTDLYAGAANIFKCSITAQNPTCATNPFLNLTHVYGCSPTAAPAHVNPSQHAIAFANSNLIYFGNDGGIYRTTRGTELNSGSCDVANPFDNLNGTMGSLAQLAGFAQTESDTAALLAGAGMRTVSTNASIDKGVNGFGWAVYDQVNRGLTAINPADANEWFVSGSELNASNLPSTAISHCTQGAGCQGLFTKVIDSTTYGGDSTGFFPLFAPYMLDPNAPDQMILGTCRVWRGPSAGGTWNSALSPNFTTGDSTTCDVNHLMASALAAGGPKVEGVGSQVIYAGTRNGTVYVTTNANAAPATWTEITSRVNGYKAWGSFPISSIAIDSSDATGKTAYLTVQGFNNGAGHVFKTTNASTWTAISGDPANGGLPDAPASAIAIDPNDSNTLYVGTDVGVFVSTDGGAHWVEYGPTSGAGSLPNVVVTKIEADKAANKLRVSTYGRGMWEIDLATYKTFTQSVTPVDTKVALGSSTTFAVTLTPMGAFNADVTVSCTVPVGSGITCTPNPATITTGNSSVVTASTTAGTTPVGANSITITSTGGGITRTDTVTLRVADFSVVVPPAYDGSSRSSATIKAGSAATYPIAIESTSDYTYSVGLTCSGLPDKATCTFTPGSIALGAISTMTITTKAANTAMLTTPKFGHESPLFAFWFGLPGIVIAGAGVRSNRKKILMLALLVVLLIAMVGMTACGSKNETTPVSDPGTPPGTYTVTVSAAGGNLTRTTTVTLIVQ